MNLFKIIPFYYHEQSKAWVELKWPYCFTCKDETTMCKGRCNRLVATWLVHQNSLFLITFNIVCHSRIQFNFGLKTSFCMLCISDFSNSFHGTVENYFTFDAGIYIQESKHLSNTCSMNLIKNRIRMYCL